MYPSRFERDEERTMRRAEDYFNTCKRHWCFWAIIILIPIVQSSNNTFVIIRGSEDSFTATRPDGCQHSIATRTKSNRDVFHCKCDHGTYFYQQELKTTCVKNDQLAILQGKQLARVITLRIKNTYYLDK